MSGDRLCLNPRYFKVTEATWKVHLKWFKISERLDLPLDVTLGILLEIASATNKALDLKHRYGPMTLDSTGEEFLTELKAVEKEYELTAGESLRILLDAAAGEVKYMIRHERHPNDPDKKGDEA